MATFFVWLLAVASGSLLMSAASVVEGFLSIPPPRATFIATSSSRTRSDSSSTRSSTSTALFYKNVTASPRVGSSSAFVDTETAPDVNDSSNDKNYENDGLSPTPPELVADSVSAAVSSSSTTTTTTATSTTTSFDNNCFPGRDENERYDCDPSVAIWRDFQVDESTRPYTAQDNIRDMLRIAGRFVNEGRTRTNGGGTLSSSSSYFAAHVARSMYFVVNALLGNAAFEFSNRNNNNKKDTGNSNGNPSALPLGLSSGKATRLLLEALLCYEQDYFDSIARGVYREPWDMKTNIDTDTNTLSIHRQSNPINAITQTNRFVRESVGVLKRRSRGSEIDKQVKFFRNSNSNSNNSGEGTNGITKTQPSITYPEYYQTAFHYQKDGWMSSESANVYETSTETLFLGRQDSMQRTSLPPLMELSKKLIQARKNHNDRHSGARPMRVLEVACGTGRFMTFVRDNLPLDTEYTALDLSPFYLEKASDNDEYWVRTRQREEERRRRNGTRKSSTPAALATTATIHPANLVQAPAENLPFPDGSFDAVVCVYLFHEIPRDVRAVAAAEMARVVAPGGTVVLTDSIQKGDRPALDTALGKFQKMNEPYYLDYIHDDLGSHFEKEGLAPMVKMVRSTTKSLSFSKPA